ncbi:MAG: hypothetical protein KME42_08505 [Tildeniella nuda ZEHNDER 1965/U140]|jgi:uncharacterized protein (TIGR02646 family)|nr:hypothetical protein [Tildeniella nuda ZEHNDER 1965/U140]
MIPVTRIPEPKAITRNGVRWLRKVKETRDSLNNALADPSKKNEINKARNKLKQAIEKYRHDDIKKALVKMFLGKCAYCESRIPHITYGAIEHFRPKSDPAFEHLAFEWTNLLLSCDICNDAGHKGTKFPVDSSGNPLFIDPTDGVINPNTHLDFSWDEVAELASIYGRDAKGQEVERVFELNRKELLKIRSQHIKLLIVLLELAKTGHPGAIALLKESCEPGAEYSAFALIHICPHLP